MQHLPLRTTATLRHHALAVAVGAAVAVAPCAGQVEVTWSAGVYAPTADALGGEFICAEGDVSASSCEYPMKQETAPIVGGRVTDWLSTRIAVEGSVGYARSDVLGKS